MHQYIQNIMELKVIKKLLITTIFTTSLITLTTFSQLNKIYAASPSFSVSPASGYVKVGTDFVFDIKVDSAGNTLSLARAVLTYDPTMVKIIKAEKNSAIFCSWPQDQQTVDNVNGVLMVTAFCQSGNSGVYKTVGEADVLARVTMRALKAGSVDFKWQWTGEDQAFKSVLIEDGSPPQNLLSPAPMSFKFIAAVITTPTTPPTTPKTGIFETETYIIAGIVFGAALLIFGGTTLLLMTNKRMINRKFKTLVIYEDDEEL
jgi:hypothetical protein